MSNPELNTLLKPVEAAAREAGKMLLEYQLRLSELQIDSKSSQVDLVSQADREAEDLIRARLSVAAPEIDFIGEETSTADTRPDKLSWVVDPLDGTSNYLSGLHIWSVSIGLCDADMQPLLGMIFAPRMDKLWAGAIGMGTSVNGSKVSVRTTPPGGGLENAMLATGFPYDVCTKGSHDPIDHFSKMQHRFHKIRRMGSAAIDLALVAEGIFDGLWETKLHSWDTAAGILLVRESGGIVSRFDGSHYTPGDADLICASNETLATEIRKTLGYLS